MTDSSTGGYITQSESVYAPLEDADFENVIQSALVGLTAVDGDLVRPRWQPEPPTLPASTVTWIAFGVQTQQDDIDSYEQHLDVDNGADLLYHTQAVEVLISFYGPAAGAAADAVRVGLRLSQNREALAALGIHVVDATKTTLVPALINEIWYRRMDMVLSLRRSIVRIYPILTLVSATGQLETDISRQVRPLTITGD